LGYYDNVFFNLNDNSMSMIFMQTPKEKAKELVEKFYKWVATPNDRNIEFYKSKECAKLHIRLVLENEILKPSNNLVIEYYHRVEEEIDKL
jgi:hypothetical protein